MKPKLKLFEIIKPGGMPVQIPLAWCVSLTGEKRMNRLDVERLIVFDDAETPNRARGSMAASGMLHE